MLQSSIVKYFQILYNFYAGLLAKPPCICERPMRLETEIRPATDDSKVYTFDLESGQYKIYKVIKIDENLRGLVSVIRFKIEAWEPLYMIPSFGNVGCFKMTGEENEAELLAKCDISGKAVLIGSHFLVTIPKIVLDEAV